MNIQRSLFQSVVVPLVALALWLGSGTPLRAASASPVGRWDFAISGGYHQGNAFVQFNSDNTLTGFEVVGQVSPRGTNTIPATNLLGSASLSGFWQYDQHGHLIGFLDEGSILLDSGDPRTNGISFVGTTSRGRMTLSGESATGRYLYRGVTNSTAVGLAAGYTAYVTRGGLRSIQFLTFVADPAFPNSYLIVGNAPGGLTVTGVAQVSARGSGSMALTYSDGSSSNIVSSVTGSVNFRSGTWKLSGADSTGAKVVTLLNRQVQSPQ